MDGVTFGRNGRDAETWRLHHAAIDMSGVAIPGRSLMYVCVPKSVIWLLDVELLYGIVR